MSSGRNPGCAASNHKDARTRCYLPDDREAILAEIQKTIEKYPNCSTVLAIQLQFKLGLRIGELSR